MIEKQELYVASCDVCHGTAEDEYVPMFHDSRDAESDLREKEWLIGDGVTGEIGKHYCPDCHSVSDDDVVTIKTHQEKAMEDPAYLPWLHELTTLGYDVGLVISTDNGNAVAEYFLRAYKPGDVVQELLKPQSANDAGI